MLSLVLLTACEENLDDNNVPGLQSVRNGELFKATNMVAVLNDDGSVTITGSNDTEQLVLELESATAGTYPLGESFDNEAIYTNNNVDIFSTDADEGSGQVVLSSATPQGSLTGTFSFVSYLPMNADSLYMRRGVIHQVPFGLPDDTTNPGSDTDVFNAQIDGADLNPTTIQVQNTAGVILVSAINGTNLITLTFPENIAVGSYTLSSSGNYLAFYQSGTNPSSADSGTLDITAVDTAAGSVTGTFSFTTAPPDSFNVTNGEFTVFY